MSTCKRCGERPASICVRCADEIIEAGCSFAPTAGWATAQATALQDWMKEVTALLCYQPEVPMKHKEDLCAALNRYNEITAQLNLGKSPNE